MLFFLLPTQCPAFVTKFLSTPTIPTTEGACGFAPLKAVEARRHQIRLTAIAGSQVASSGPWPAAETVLSARLPVDPYHLPLRDPNFFVAKQLGKHLDHWQPLLAAVDKPTAALVHDWLSAGVQLQHFLQPFKGIFRGTYYDLARPDAYYQTNAPSCRTNPEVIARTLEERLTNGSLQLIGRWDQLHLDQLPVCIMPLTLDAKKQRVCHDDTF